MTYETTGGSICPGCGQAVILGAVHLCPNSPWDKLNAAPIGCICPPGANKECERHDCPRKRIQYSATVAT